MLARKRVRNMAKPNEDFQALMQRVLAGSDEAAQELFDRYAPYLLRAIRRRLNSRIRAKFDSQDFAQEVWASFFAESPNKRVFDSPSSLVAFLTILARNKVVEAVRQRTQTLKRDVAREQSLDDSRSFDKGRIVGNEPTPSQVVMSQEEWGAFLGKQPPVYRRVLILLRAGSSPVEIAKELGVHRRTVLRIAGRFAPEAIS
jgi:RNA polymerase sigma factor (sigma-70 family)